MTSDDIRKAAAKVDWARNDDYHEFDAWGVVLEAARLAADVKDGEPIDWCEPHKAQGVPRLGRPSDRCWKGEWLRHLTIEDCRMVPRLLAPAPEGGE